MKDIRYALRQFANAPVFTAMALLTLALGIGATTAIFTLVHAVLLNSLPVAKPSELYRVGDVENCYVSGGLQDEEKRSEARFPPRKNSPTESKARRHSATTSTSMTSKSTPSCPPATS